MRRSVSFIHEFDSQNAPKSLPKRQWTAAFLENSQPRLWFAMKGLKTIPRILVVDDDDDVLRLMGVYLKHHGFQLDLATSAEQARDFLKVSRYDVVVSDFKMPGESGLDLFSYVSSVHPETPFVLITGCDDLRIKRESMRMGVHEYLTKPFHLDALHQIIINLMQRDIQKKVASFDRLESCLRPTLKIAFCDDDEGELLIMRRMLEDAGYSDAICACSFSGEELLDSLWASNGNLPDVILLDILMLFKDGLEALEKIKLDAKFQNVPVLLVAGSPEYAEAVLKKFPLLAIDGTLTKPITADSFATLLSSLTIAVEAGQEDRSGQTSAVANSER